MSAQTPRTAFIRSVQEVGGSRQVAIPSEVAHEWGVNQGDTVKVRKKDNGAIILSPCE